MKLPKSVEILGKTIAIRRMPLGDDHAEYSHDEGAISIDTALKPDQVWPALFHEMVHAYLHISGVVEMVTVPGLEEGVCRALENMAHLVKLK